MENEEKFWKAMRAGDTSSMGRIFYGVVTTGIFCRPGCPARAPKRENVRFYATAAEAEAAGMRACLRCKPMDAPTDPAADRVREACTFIRRHLQDREALTLANLSDRYGVSPFHFQRGFKKITGVTPRQYVEALRVETLKEDLRSGSSVTDAVYNAGFGSASRAYMGAESRLGMTPGQYRAGGLQADISYATAETPLGMVMLAATDRGLCFVEFGSSEADLLHSLREEFPRAVLQPMRTPPSSHFAEWMRSLSKALAGDGAAAAPVLLHGTAFQTKVWRHLQTIPAGTVQTYTEVAAAIGNPKAVRAVASACAANRVAILIPCHRVIRGDGGLGGYRWGIDRKRALLQVEREVAQTASAPVHTADQSGLLKEAARENQARC